MICERRLYRKNLKNWEFGKEAPSDFCLERANIAARQGASEDKNLRGEPTQAPGSPKNASFFGERALPKTNSSGYFGIYLAKYLVEGFGILHKLNQLIMKRF